MNRQIASFSALLALALACQSDGAAPPDGAPDAAATGTDGGTTGGGGGTASNPDASGSPTDALGPSPDAGAADVAPAALAPAEFALALAAAYCDLVAPCCAPLGSVRADCVTFHQARAQEILDSLSATQRYDAGHAASCVAALRASPRTCAADFDWTSAFRQKCAMVVRGTRAPGESCNGPEDCSPPEGGIGNRETGFAGCAPYGDVTSKRCRRFNPATQVGTMCEMGFGGDATEVFVCAGQLRCEAGLCVQPPPSTLPALGATCDPIAGCSEGFCDEGTKKCTAFGRTGDVCQAIPCAQSHLCIESINKCAYVVPAPSLGFGDLSAWESCTYQ